jgi:hypothetical protein
MVDLTHGIISTIAGNGVAGFSGDGGPAVEASLDLSGAKSPEGIVADQSQDVWFVDDNLSRVRTFTVGSGTISTYVGGGAGGDGGPAQTASLTLAHSLALSSVAYKAGSGTVYIGCRDAVRAVDMASQNITTVAGSGNSTPASGVPALSSGVGEAEGLAVDPSGDLFIDSVDFSNGARFFTPFDLVLDVNAGTQLLSYTAGTVANSGSYLGDGAAATSAGLSSAGALCLSGNGDLYLIDGIGIRKVSATTHIITTVGGGAPAVPTASNGVRATGFALSLPTGPVPGPTPTDLLVGYTQNGGPFQYGQVLAFHPASGLLTVFAGNRLSGTAGDGGLAVNAALSGVDAVCRDGAGNVYVGDATNDCLRRIDAASGDITLVAGVSYTAGSTGDGLPALSPLVTLGTIRGLACAPGWIYVTDWDKNSVRGINTATGVISLVAGAGLAGGGAPGYVNGPALSARFNQPGGLATDAAGNVYVADQGNNAVRKIDLTALTVTTVAGLGPTEPGYLGDGGPAVAAALNNPMGVWLDPSGDIFIADQGNNRVRKIAAGTGIISTVAGTGIQGFNGDGPVQTAQFSSPQAGFVDSGGDLFVNDAGNLRVREVTYYHTPTPTPVSAGYGKPVAYPSPASDHICFSYYAKGGGHVGIQVYNLGFQLAARFDDNVAGAGAQVTCGDTSRLATGAYLYRLTLPDGTTDTGKFKVIH